MATEFIRPQREIHNIEDVSKWLNSEAHKKYMTFLRRLNNAIKGTSTTSNEIEVSENVGKIIKMLDEFQVNYQYLMF